MKQKIQQIEEDMQKLSQMSQTLFTSWQDNISEHFSEGCLKEMERMWKQYATTVTPLLDKLNKIEEEMQERLQNCQKR